MLGMYTKIIEGQAITSCLSPKLLLASILAVTTKMLTMLTITQNNKITAPKIFFLKQVFSYIKEFAHGDFGRTKPNLGDLLNTETDILQLDVEVFLM